MYHALKKNTVLRNVGLTVNKVVFPILYELSQVAATKYLYRVVMGKKLNLHEPRDFNEKIHWLKLFWRHPLVVRCSDKYEVRRYAEEVGCEKILNELYGVYEDVKEIDWSRLPAQFALKCTHGCGFNIICHDKNLLNQSAVLTKLDQWMKVRYGRLYGEPQYDRIRPRIICEKYLGTDAGLWPNDYKVFCFNGKPRLIAVITDRDAAPKRFYMDLDWKIMYILRPEYTCKGAPQKPHCLDELLLYAERLSAPFPFVRVDFYVINNSPILGEMTFTPTGGVGKTV